VQIETQLILLLATASLIAVFAQRARVPYTIAMVLTGVAVSIFGTTVVEIPKVVLTRHLILVTFLPGLLFDAAFNLDLQELRDNIRTISILAVPGILISATIVTVILVVLIKLPIGLALLFGALISATDPIAVLAIFKELGVPKRLGIIVEGESLFNDGTALVFFEIVLAIVLGHEEFSFAGSIAQFFVVVAGGIVLGLVAGLLFAQMMRRTEDPFIDMALTMVLAYGTFLIAEELGISPVIAVVVAGLYVGNFAAQGGLAASTRLTLNEFWEYLAFLINSAIFLIIGLDVDLRLLAANATPVAVAILAMLVARLLVIYPLGFIANKRSRRGLPLRWVHVLYWGGLRGSVSLALALSLPSELPQRNLLELMAFGAVFFSVVIQGLTMRPLLTILKMTQPSELRQEYERLRARWTILHVATHAVDRLHAENAFSGSVRDRLKRTFNQQTAEAWNAVEALTAQHPELIQADIQAVRKAIAEEQKVALYDMLRRGSLSDEVYFELNAEIDERISKIYSEEQPAAPLPVVSAQAGSTASDGGETDE
jgi:CPA1 family monovalent cation:H+ antiporter